MTPGNDTDHDQHVEPRHRAGRHVLKGQERRGRPWWYTGLAIVGALVLVAVVFFVPLELTSSTSYCTSCKQMRVAGDSWAHSAHAKVACVSCHVPPGFVNGIRWRLGETRNIWATYLGADQSMIAVARHTPGNAACEKCHDVAHLPPVINGIKIPHQAHVTLHNLVCADCHPGVSHAVNGQTAQVSMMSCSMCHNGSAAPDACSTCHITVPAANVHPPDFLKTHGVKALINEQDCLRCHHDKAAFCDACHSRPPASHFAGDWRYSHGPAAKADRSACLGCHSEATFCEQCHRVNHPADWITTHPAVAAKGTESCLVCHPQSMCDTCHRQRGVTP